LIDRDTLDQHRRIKELVDFHELLRGPLAPLDGFPVRAPPLGFNPLSMAGRPFGVLPLSVCLKANSAAIVLECAEHDEDE